MHRFLLILSMIWLLAGCQGANGPAQDALAAQRDAAPELVLRLLESKRFADFLAFTEDGRHFLTGSRINRVQVKLYDSKRLTPMTHEVIADRPVMAGGTGLIDANTYYFTLSQTDVDYPQAVSIWQLQPPRQVAFQQFDQSADRPLVANHTYVAYLDTLLNWHTGERFPILRAHHSGIFRLTTTGQVMTFNPDSRLILLHDPLTGNSLSWKSDAEDGDLAITSNASYVLDQGSNGICTVKQLPALTLHGRCGNHVWFSEKTGRIALNSQEDAFAVAWGSRVRLYQLEPFRQTFEITMPGSVTALAVAANGRLAVTDDTGRLELWDTRNARLLGQARNVKGRVGNPLAIDPEGKQILAANDDGNLLVFGEVK